MRQALIAVVLVLCACAPGSRPEVSGSLLDGFDHDPLWGFDSADDHAEVACEAGEAVQGATALVVRARTGTRGRVVVRKDVDLDASGLTGLTVHARTITGPPPLLALVLRGADGTWLESPPMPLTAAWTRTPTWDPRTLPAWAATAPRIERLLLIVIPQGGDCTIAVDDLRADGTWRWRSEPAELVRVEPVPAAAQRHQPLQLVFAVAWPPPAHQAALPAGEGLLRRMVAGGAWVTAPDGERWFQPAACVGTTIEDGRVLHRYAVRVAPDRAGPWSLEAGLVGAAGRWSRAAPTAVVVDGAAHNPGPVSLDPTDRRWLRRADGSFFWPLGMNVAWAQDYTPWLDLLARDGCTALRVWLTPWGNPLVAASDPGVVDQASAAAIDALLDGALARGLTVQLCLTYHGWFGADWARNPFNRVNGGPIADAREFWSDARAKAGFRRLLEYASARWGHHPALLAWELVNEVDLVPRYRDQDLIDWHREMAAHLARVDRRRHLVTTSVARPGRLDELWRLDGIDVINIHRYEADDLRAMAQVAAAIATAGKPGWAAEAGYDWRPAQAQADVDGEHLRRSLWWSWVHGLSASSWAWWWDVQVQGQGLTRHHAALARYLADEDPRGTPWRSVAVAAGDVAAAALLGPDRGYAYAVRGRLPRTAGSGPLVLHGLAPGRWLVERWDPVAGTLVEGLVAEVGSDGRLTLTVPDEAAWKLRRDPPLPLRLELP